MNGLSGAGLKFAIKVTTSPPWCWIVLIRAAGSLIGAVGLSGAPGGDKDKACAALKTVEERVCAESSFSESESPVINNPAPYSH